MEVNDLIFKIVSTALLVANFVVFLWLAIEVTKLSHFKSRLPSTYKSGRFIAILVAMLSILFAGVVWSADFQQKVTDPFKIGLLLFIVSFTVMGIFFVTHRRELFPYTIDKQQSA